MSLAASLGLTRLGVSSRKSEEESRRKCRERGLSAWKYFLWAAIQSVAMAPCAVDNSGSPAQTISWRRSSKLRNNYGTSAGRSCADKSATTAVNAVKASAALSEVVPLSLQSGQSHSLLKKRIVPGRLRASPTFCAIHLCPVVAPAFLPYVLVPRTQRSAAALGCAHAETLALAAYFWGLASGLEPVGQLSN
jgi:hypothetical protein